MQVDDANTFSEIWYAIQYFSPGAIPITLLALLIIFIFERPKVKAHPLAGLIPGALWAVVLGILMNKIYQKFFPDWVLSEEHLVNIPKAENLSDLLGLLTFPDFSGIGSGDFWVIAVTIAVIASIETLLSIEAGDKMDPKKRLTPTSKELIAQGVGNSVSGLIGGSSCHCGDCPGHLQILPRELNQSYQQFFTEFCFFDFGTKHPDLTQPNPP